MDGIPTAPRRVVIVGGGYAGASLAVQLVRRAPRALEITIIEPRADLGRGLAYSTDDPNHRLNAPAYVHSVLPEDCFHFTRWAQDRGLLAQDPGALHPDGGLYYRRADFGRYIGETLAAHADWPRTGSTIRHLRDVATSLAGAAQAVVGTEAGRQVAADLVVIATGNAPPRLPRSIARPRTRHPGLIENPFEPGRLRAVSPDAEVLVVGAGLTALDSMATLLAQGHRGAIAAVSRHGLTPRAQAPIAPAMRQDSTAPPPPPTMFLDRVQGPGPDFLDPAGTPRTALGWLRALRRKIAEVEAGGGTWHQPFDAFRDDLWRLWPSLPVAEQRRALRRLRTMYDVHRFRTPPQTEALVAAAAAGGQVRYAAGRVTGLGESGGRLRVDLQRPGRDGLDGQVVDVVINASGIDTAAGIAANPFLAALAEAGAVRADACGLGLEVDSVGRAIGVDGTACEWLRTVGPPTLGTFGDPIGAFYVGAQIRRFIPSMLGEVTPQS